MSEPWSRWQAIEELSSGEIEAWSRLSAHALEPDVFQAPLWVIPSVRANAVRSPDGALSRPRLLLAGRDELEACWVLCAAPASPRVPVPHWRLYSTRHTYQTAPAVSESGLALLPTMVHALREGGRAPVVDLPMLPAGTLSRALERAAADAGGDAVVRRTWRRAAIDLSEDVEALAPAMSKNRRKRLRRAERRLAEHGELSFRVLRGDDALAEGVERFLALEHYGWKGAGGSSLRASSMRESWFREVCAGLAEHDGLVVTALHAGSRVAATSVNFELGGVGFGFKMGWDSALADASPGWLHERSFVADVRRAFPHARLVDAVADAGSFVEDEWPDRRDIHALTLCCDATSAEVVRLAHVVTDRTKRAFA